MKRLRLYKSIAALPSILVLAMGLGSSAFAGPGPQYMQQMEKIRGEKTANRAAAPVPVPHAIAAQTNACPYCRTKVVEEASFYNVSGKIAPRQTVIGEIHSCDGCSGIISRSRGKTTDEMKRTCPTCATAAPGCFVKS